VRGACEQQGAGDGESVLTLDESKLPADCEVWRSGDVVLVRGDCLQVLPAVSGVDAVVTSPPYDNLRRYDGLSEKFEGVLNGLQISVVQGGVVVWVVADQTERGSESCTSFRQAIRFTESGFRLHDTMIFQKQNPPPLTHNRYEQEFEYMFVFSAGRPNTFNGLRVPSKHAGRTITGTKRHNLHDSRPIHKAGQPIQETKLKGNVWSYPVGVELVPGHPAVFPLQLASDHVSSWTNESDLVLDPFTGSGTTGVACVNLGRKFIGIEISSEYFAIAKDRIAQAQAAKAGLLIA